MRIIRLPSLCSNYGTFFKQNRLTAPERRLSSISKNRAEIFTVNFQPGNLDFMNKITAQRSNLQLIERDQLPVYYTSY